MTSRDQLLPNVDVTLVPVSVRQDGVDGHPTLMGWPDADGRWATEPVADTPSGTAQRLLARNLPPGAQLLTVNPRPVGFVEQADGSDRRLTLIYTSALPMALCDPEAPDAERWIALLHPEERKSTARQAGSSMVSDAPFARAVLVHWREALEATGAALRFLAGHWTAPQLRDVYSAVWGYKQDTASFTKWAFRSPGAFKPFVQKEESPDLTDAVAEGLYLASELASQGDTDEASQKPPSDPSATDRAAWTALSKTLTPGKTGLIVAAGVVPGVVLASAAARVAYRSSSRGAPPKTWYETRESDPEGAMLAHTYPSRPAWLGRGD